MPYADKYKKRGSRYEDERFLRAAVKQRERRETRLNDFSSRRNIQEDILKPVAENLTDNIKGKMNLRLLQWKQKKEREKQEAIEKRKKKPPFVVGVVHHKMVPKFPSPVNSGKHNKKNKVEKPLAPVDHKFKAPSSVIPILMLPPNNKQNSDLSSNKRLKKEPNQACLSGRKLNSIVIKRKRNEITPRRSARLSLKTKEALAGSNSSEIKNSPAPVLTSIEESGEQNVISEEEVKCDWKSHSLMFAASLSPFICKARGKDRIKSPAKKAETPVKSRESGLRRQIAQKIIEEKLNDHLEMEKKGSPFLTEEGLLSPLEDPSIALFRKCHSDEMRRLGSLCLDWDVLLMSQEIPTEIQDAVRTTVCQARLLMREKLAQFKGLVDRSASSGPSTQCRVTHSDLEGFWDLVSIQIEDINNKFKKLDDLKSNNWVEIVEEASSRKLRARNVNKEPLKKEKPNLEKKSALQLFLLEKRRKKDADENTVVILTPSSKVSKCSPKQGRKSTRMPGSACKEGESSTVSGTPRKVTFKGLDGDAETPRKLPRLPATPHNKKASLNSPKSTPLSKRRSIRLAADFYSSDEG